MFNYHTEKLTQLVDFLENSIKEINRLGRQLDKEDAKNGDNETISTLRISYHFVLKSVLQNARYFVDIIESDIKKSEEVLQGRIANSIVCKKRAITE